MDAPSSMKIDAMSCAGFAMPFQRNVFGVVCSQKLAPRMIISTNACRACSPVSTDDFLFFFHHSFLLFLWAGSESLSGESRSRAGRGKDRIGPGLPRVEGR